MSVRKLLTESLLLTRSVSSLILTKVGGGGRAGVDPMSQVGRLRPKRVRRKVITTANAENTLY